MEQIIIDWEQEFLLLQEKYDFQEKSILVLEKHCAVLAKRIQDLEKKTITDFETGECLSCGEVFQTSKKGRKKLYCSARCRKREQRTRQLFKEYGNVTFLKRDIATTKHFGG